MCVIGLAQSSALINLTSVATGKSATRIHPPCHPPSHDRRPETATAAALRHTTTLSRCWGTQYPLLRRPRVLNSKLRRKNIKTCTIPKLSQHYICNINSFHLVRIRGSWVFGLQPARVGSGKLREGNINQRSMLFFRIF